MLCPFINFGRNTFICSYFTGPLVGILGQRFGIKVVTFVGGVVAAAGAGLCSVAPNVLWLDVFWGGIHGKKLKLCGYKYIVTLLQGILRPGKIYKAEDFDFKFSFH